ncbi:DUF3427 domain-containing protein [Gordonia sp. VNK21]|uniref:DUF3427 domain-containing protein n=1 Tax=Gordonia sp. VNK21 TaxID=3382483 RepID=UPI0038D35CF7
MFDEQSQKMVVDNLKQQLRARWKDMATDLRNLGNVSLRTYLDETGFELNDVLKPGTNRGSWTQLRRAADIVHGTASDAEQQLAKRTRVFAHVDDPLRHRVFVKLLGPEPVRYQDLTPVEQTLARMLFFNVWPNGGEFSDYDQGFAILRDNDLIRNEISEIVDISFTDTRTATVPLDQRFESVPLRVHGRYNREEILSALGHASFDSLPNHFREGVKYFPDLNVDMLLVTLVKSDSGFSPTTMYRDYPISRSLFHWESQSTTTLRSPTGQRYVNGTSNVLIFARTNKTDELGARAYTFLGPATYASHEGERPISIVWKLDHEMPAELFNEAKVAAG